MEITNHTNGIRIAVLQGSVRPNNNTAKAMALVVDELRRQHQVTVDVIDPTDMDLPLPGKPSTPDAKYLEKVVSEATGVVLTTPEYHGTFSSVMKLMIENMGFPSVMSGKPVALLGVAAGRIGAIKSLEQLRGVASHVGAIVLPAPVSVANVRSVFDAEGNCLDPGVEKFVRSVATTLMDYIQDTICPKYSLEAFVRQTQAA